MIAFIVTSILCFITYLLLTTGSGTFGLWSLEEILLGVILSLITGFITRKIFIKKDFRMINPVRWLTFIIYIIGPFFIGMAKSNIDVAYRVITGKIKPGIVRISPNLKTDLGITLLANSITLTPGTLSVDIDEEKNDLFIHWINVDEKELKGDTVETRAVCGDFEKWVRRITE